VADALRVVELGARGFRNLEPLALQPGPRFNVLHGDNGQGKSNLLEALDYLGTLRSFRAARTDDLIREGSEQALLTAKISGSLVPRSYEIRLGRQKARQVKLDGKRPHSRGAYFTSLQLVLFHAGDMLLTQGPPEPRRAFLDRILEQFDATYAATLHSYVRALKSRNRLLRAEKPNRSAITAYDELLASAGAVVGQTRAGLLESLTPRVVEAFRDIAGETLPLTVRYAPRVTPEVAEIRKALAQSLDKDLARGFTAEGPHADDLELELSGTPAKRFASQGQHRAMVLALKVAELHELERRVGRVPILLLDDVSSELDRGRNRRLFELLAGLGGQVFLTTTHREFILLETDRKDFAVKDGVISEG
jgi:DNA replication and repair protein RecF